MRTAKELRTEIDNSIKINDNYGIDTYTIKNGYIYKKMIKKHPDTNKIKLIISNPK